LGHARSVKFPTLIEDLIDEFIVNAYCGYSSSLFESLSGNLFGVGSNDSNQLCLYGPRHEHVCKLSVFEDMALPFKKIVMSRSHSLFMTIDGRLFVCSQDSFPRDSLIEQPKHPSAGDVTLYRVDTSQFTTSRIQNIHAGNNVFFLLTGRSFLKLNQ